MADQVGLRERKRQQTRQALISVAIRLFAEKGYDQTTVAEITAAAGVSTKTFFNYFASKDEVLFPHLSGRIDGAAGIIEQRKPGETVARVLVRAVEYMLAEASRDELAAGLASARLPMIMPSRPSRPPRCAGISWQKPGWPRRCTAPTRTFSTCQGPPR